MGEKAKLCCWLAVKLEKRLNWKNYGKLSPTFREKDPQFSLCKFFPTFKEKYLLFQIPLHKLTAIFLGKYTHFFISTFTF